MRCRKCNHWKFSGTPCKCKFPDFPNIKTIQAQNMQEFHFNWAKECLRVLKPGGYLLSFGGTRTYHRMTCGIEDAGFEIRDCIMWIYSTGFPKSLNIGKQIDKYGRLKYFDVFRKKLKEIKQSKNIKSSEVDKHFNFYMSGHWFGDSQPTIPTKEQYEELKIWWELNEEQTKELEKVFEEAEREIIGKQKTNLTVMQRIGEENVSGDIDITIPSTKEAKEWEGWGTALKPAVEPIVVARKPLSEKNVALNVLKWGTGGINIDESRIETTEQDKYDLENRPISDATHQNTNINFTSRERDMKHGIINQGRFPANIIFDEESAKVLDEQSGISKSKQSEISNKGSIWNSGNENKEIRGHNDRGGASRFFYVAKSSKAERNFGLDEYYELKKDISEGIKKEIIKYINTD
ncbi:MAG: DNA methyltransferase [Nanoarchaeota archaeon]